MLHVFVAWQPGVFFLETLQLLCLVEAQATVLGTPSVVSLLSDADLSYGQSYGLAVGYFYLSQLVQDLFW